MCQEITSEEKLQILKELLEKKSSIREISEKYNVNVNDIYAWEKKLFYNEVSYIDQNVFSASPKHLMEGGAYF